MKMLRAYSIQGSNYKETDFEYLDWIQMVLDMIQQGAFVNTVMDLRIT
jgi:hypothetical protein